MLVGNYFNHGLYHGLIPIMNVPFLNSAPAPLMYVSRVRDIMHQGTVHLPELCHIGELTMLMKRIEGKKVLHNAFPIVESGNTDLLKGLLSKKDFFHLMEDFNNPRKREHMLTGPNHNLIDLMDYADRSPLTVFPHTTVARAYSILRKLGLRHLIVIERNGKVSGIITRKDLMLYKLVDSHERELNLVVMLQRMVREKQARSGFKPKDGVV